MSTSNADNYINLNYCVEIVQLKLSVTHLKGIKDLNRRAREKGFLFMLSFWRWHTDLLIKEYQCHVLQDPTPGHTSVHILALFLLLHLTMKGSEIWTRECRRNQNSSVGNQRRHSRSWSHPRLPTLKLAWLRAAEEFISWNKAWVLIIVPVWTFKLLKRACILTSQSPAHLGTAETRSSSGVS